MSLRRAILGVAAAVMLALPAAMTAALRAADNIPPVYLVKGVAISGYDPVAYFTDKKPVKGNPAIALEHESAKYFFASEEHRELFKREPDKYLPQYGGYCAWAVFHGSTAKTDPTAWTIHDGKLFLNYDKGVKVSWDKNLARHIVKADANWPKIVGVEKATARVAPPADKMKDIVKEPAKDAAPEAMKAAVKDEDAAKTTAADTAKAAAEVKDAMKDAAKEPDKDAAKDKN